MDCTQDLHHQQQLEQQELEEQLKVYHIKPNYCDKIAKTIKDAMAFDPDNIIKGCTSIKLDLDEDGAFLSTKKTMWIVDRNGKQYKISVEEA
jgi:aspartate/glutamate racemase